MIKEKSQKIVALLLAFAMVVALVPGLEAKAADYDQTITIYHTNDMHGRGIGDPATETNDAGEEVPVEEGSIGYERYKTILDEARAEGDVLVFDAGDNAHGQTFVNLSEGKNAMLLLNAVEADAMTLGNHEFNYGSESVINLQETADFPILAANIIEEATRKAAFEENMVKDVNGTKVGVFGMTTPETKYKAHPDNTAGLLIPETIEENVRIAQEQVDELKAKGATVIIMLSHYGVDPTSEVKSTDMAAAVEGIDLIIDGHSHTAMPEGTVVGDTLIAQTGGHFEQLGKVTLNLNGGVVVDKSAVLLPFAELRDVEADEKVAAMIKEMNDANAEVLGKVVGTTTVELDGVRENVRTKETNMGNLITDAMVAKDDQVDAALTNGGGIRAPINAGEITMKEVLDVLPFGNQMTVIEVTGQQIVDAIVFGTDGYPAPEGKFPHVSEITYDIYVGENGNEVYNVTIGGEPIDLGATYNLATNDFMATGGDGYTMFKGTTQVALYDSLENIVAEYITANSPITPEVKGRIEVLEEVTADDVRYYSTDQEPAGESEYRISGPNRVETSIEVAKAAFPEGTDTVVLTNDTNGADALTVAPLADLLDAPILLTAAEELNPAVSQAITDLGADRVVIIGGENSISTAVEQALTDTAEVERISGETRFETAAKIAEAVDEIAEVDKAIIVNEVYADALSAANLATRIDAPILLVETDSIPEVTAEKLDDLDQVIVIGGNATVSDDVLATIKGEVEDTVRVSGSDRYATSVEVAKYAVGEEPAKDMVFAQGNAYIDALVVIPNLADNGQVLLLVAQDHVPTVVEEYMKEVGVEKISIVGGTDTISIETEEQLIDIAG